MVKMNLAIRGIDSSQVKWNNEVVQKLKFPNNSNNFTSLLHRSCAE
ncbi:MAG: hypothetical protein FWG29_09430 [Treponema sp.]|nr:hypothetical protein [Treponema sp.]